MGEEEYDNRFQFSFIPFVPVSGSWEEGEEGRGPRPAAKLCQYLGIGDVHLMSS